MCGQWHAKDYEEEDDDEDWEYETEDEDEVVDRKLSLGEVAIDEEEDDEEEEEEIPPPPITPQEVRSSLVHLVLLAEKERSIVQGQTRQSERVACDRVETFSTSLPFPQK